MKFLFALIALFALLSATVNAVDRSACAQPKVVGPCRMAGFFYYYNGDTTECEKFIYGGCQGNDNRFETKEECEKTCK